MLQVDSIEEFAADGTPVTLLACIGTMSAPDSYRLDDQLDVCLRHGPRHVILDITEVRLADPAAAAVLNRAHQQAGAAACTFTVVTPRRGIVVGVDLNGSNRLIKVQPDLTNALASLNSTHDAA